MVLSFHLKQDFSETGPCLRFPSAQNHDSYHFYYADGSGCIFSGFCIRVILVGNFSFLIIYIYIYIHQSQILYVEQ
jgi:hypothetical protein